MPQFLLSSIDKADETTFCYGEERCGKAKPLLVDSNDATKRLCVSRAGHGYFLWHSGSMVLTKGI